MPGKRWIGLTETLPSGDVCAFGSGGAYDRSLYVLEAFTSYATIVLLKDSLVGA